MGQLPKLHALSALAFLLAGPLLSAEAPAAFPRGEVVPKVPCAGTPDQSYALYLPSTYSPDRPWPILYILDPRGRGATAAEFFRAGAERLGYILASSHNTASDTAMTPNFDAMRAVWKDTHARFPLDDRRVYAAGFSGTVRAACTLATTAPGSIRGIIGAGAGFPFDRPPTKDTPFAFFGTVGTEDFNYYEVLDLEEKLQALALPHRIDVFDGTHQWPPPELAARAMGWMTLHAMRTGIREKDPALIESLWNEDLARARAAETDGNVYQAFRAWSALATTFAGLRDTAEAGRKVAELRGSEALRRDLVEREKRNKRDEEYLQQAPGILARVNPSGEPVTLGQMINALKIPELKKREQSDDPEERLSAKRLLNTLAGQTAFYLPQQFAERKQWDRALFVLSIAAEIQPGDPGVWYSQAVVHARKGDRRKALADLRRAVETGWKDAERVETHEAFAPFRDDGEFRKIVAEIKAKASPPGPVGANVSELSPTRALTSPALLSRALPIPPAGRGGRQQSQTNFKPLSGRRGVGVRWAGAPSPGGGDREGSGEGRGEGAPLPAAELPRGEIVPKIVCAAQPDRSYALYLPSSYTPERPWPILYVFDSRGINNGRAMIELFKAGAERFGLIVASSNDSSGIVPMEENFRSLSGMWTDTHARLALDDRRAYGFGFSGIVRFVLTAAIQAPGTLAGVVSASGGYPLGHPPSRKETPFPFFTMVGEKDFNYYELLDTETKLAAEGIPHRVEIFDGSHEWPSDALVTQALGWMELQAMKKGTRPKDPSLIEALWNEDLARARSLEEAGRLWRAWRTWKAMAADFEGLRDTSEAKKKVAGMEAAESFRKMLRERGARDRRDREYLERVPRLFNAVPAEIRPDSLSQMLADLRIPDLKKQEKSQDPEERLSAERVLYAVYIQTGLYLPRSAMEKEQWDRAIFFLQIAAEVDPDSSRIPYRLATAWAGKGNRKKALESLKRAVEMGGTGLEEIESDPALASLRQEKEYQELVAKLRPSPSPQ